MAASPHTLDRLGASLAIVAAERRAREAILDEVARGAVAPGAVLDDGGEAARSVRVRVLVETVPGLGRVVARRLLAELGIGDRTIVGELTPGQRSELIRRLAEVAGR